VTVSESREEKINKYGESCAKVVVEQVLEWEADCLDPRTTGEVVSSTKTSFWD
jgi:hypothetical protein